MTYNKRQLVVTRLRYITNLLCFENPSITINIFKIIFLVLLFTTFWKQYALWQSCPIQTPKQNMPQGTKPWNIRFSLLLHCKFSRSLTELSPLGYATAICSLPLLGSACDTNQVLIHTNSISLIQQFSCLYSCTYM